MFDAAHLVEPSGERGEQSHEVVHEFVHHPLLPFPVQHNQVDAEEREMPLQIRCAEPAQPVFGGDGHPVKTSLLRVVEQSCQSLAVLIQSGGAVAVHF